MQTKLTQSFFLGCTSSCWLCGGTVLLDGRSSTANFAVLFKGSASICIVTLGSQINLVIAASNGRAPELSGLTCADSLARIVHIALSAEIGCWRVTLPNPLGDAVEKVANNVASHFCDMSQLTRLHISRATPRRSMHHCSAISVL